MQTATRECALTIDHLERTVVNAQIPEGVDADAAPLNTPQEPPRGLVMGIARIAITVVLALLAILVLLPAAIAAQAANGI
jgi:hypothetical protein